MLKLNCSTRWYSVVDMVESARTERYNILYSTNWCSCSFTEFSMNMGFFDKNCKILDSCKTVNKKTTLSKNYKCSIALDRMPSSQLCMAVLSFELTKHLRLNTQGGCKKTKCWCRQSLDYAILVDIIQSVKGSHQKSIKHICKYAN